MRPPSDNTQTLRSRVPFDKSITKKSPNLNYSTQCSCLLCGVPTCIRLVSMHEHARREVSEVPIKCGAKMEWRSYAPS